MSRIYLNVSDRLIERLDVEAARVGLKRAALIRYFIAQGLDAAPIREAEAEETTNHEN